MPKKPLLLVLPYLGPISLQKLTLKKTLSPLFYWWGSTASRLEPHQGGSLLFTTKFPDTPGTHFIDLGKKRWKAESTLEPPGGSEHKNPGLGIPHLDH